MAVKNQSIIDAVRDAIHGSKISVDEIADQLAVSSNLAYKMGLDSDNGDGFVKHLQRAVQLCNITRNYGILHAMARACGGFFSREPRTAPDRIQRETLIADFNLSHALLLKQFANLLTEPTPTLKRDFDSMLNQHLSQVAEMKRLAQKNNNQISMLDILNQEDAQ